jgi:hypothetical protein
MAWACVGVMAVGHGTFLLSLLGVFFCPTLLGAASGVRQRACVSLGVACSRAACAGRIRTPPVDPASRIRWPCAPARCCPGRIRCSECPPANKAGFRAVGDLAPVLIGGERAHQLRDGGLFGRIEPLAPRRSVRISMRRRGARSSTFSAAACRVRSPRCARRSVRVHVGRLRNSNWNSQSAGTVLTAMPP